MDIAVRKAMKSSESHKMNDRVQVDEFTIGGKEEDYIFHQKIYFKKEYYITDTIRYYDFSEIRGKWLPYSGLDTIVLKKEIKAN